MTLVLSFCKRNRRGGSTNHQEPTTQPANPQKLTAPIILTVKKLVAAKKLHNIAISSPNHRVVVKVRPANSKFFCLSASILSSIETAEDPKIKVG